MKLANGVKEEAMEASIAATVAAPASAGRLGVKVKPVRPVPNSVQLLSIPFLLLRLPILALGLLCDNIASIIIDSVDVQRTRQDLVDHPPASGRGHLPQDQHLLHGAEEACGVGRQSRRR